MSAKEEVIARLGLLPLPGEGGYYRETYRGVGSAILYLVGREEFSALHRLTGDEIYHFYAGHPVELLRIAEGGASGKVVLGPDVLGGQSPQAVVRAGVWQGARLTGGGSWALLGTTMAPGFDPAAFELGSRSALSALYPGLADDIRLFTREE